jgi:hypothetical protein
VVGRVRPRTLALVGIACALAAVLVLWTQRGNPVFSEVKKLLGNPGEEYPHFTRSFEGLPRGILTYVVGARTASWGLGLAFRALAIAWLFYAAWRGTVERQPLRWAATALFIYYLFLHAYMESWYLLPLLPLATFVPAALQAPLRAFLFGLTVYYALWLPLDCDHRPLVVGAKEFLETLIVILPALVMLLVAWRRRAQARASGGTALRGA